MTVIPNDLCQNRGATIHRIDCIIDGCCFGFAGLRNGTIRRMDGKHIVYLYRILLTRSNNSRRCLHRRKLNYGFSMPTFHRLLINYLGVNKRRETSFVGKQLSNEAESTPEPFPFLLQRTRRVFVGVLEESKWRELILKKQNEEFQARVLSLILQTYCNNENRGIMKKKLQLGKGMLLPFLDCK